MSIHLEYQELDGTPYNLDSAKIDYDTLALGEVKTLLVKLKNTARSTSSIVVSAIAHPTDQVGSAEDTYDSMTFSLNEGGPYTSSLSIGSMSPSEEKTIYMKWTISATALPGWGVFAVQAVGVVTI